MKITLDINSCRECPHSTNNAREHDDPFTSGPANIYWYCRHPDNISYGDRLIIEDSYIIHPNCKVVEMK